MGPYSSDERNIATVLSLNKLQNLTILNEIKPKDFNNNNDKLTSIAIFQQCQEHHLSPVTVGKKRNQCFAAVAANLGAVAFGTMFGWTATALPGIRLDNIIEFDTHEEASWIGSIMIIGALLSGLVTGISMSKFGRRLTILALSVPCLVGWGLIFFSTNIEMIYAGRFLTGFSGGAYSVVVPVYLAEISDPDIRGILLAGFDLGIACGFLSIVVVGSFLSWRFQVIYCASLTILGHILTSFIPESPRYLLSRNEYDKAVDALCWIHAVKEPKYVLREIEELQEIIEAKKRNPKHHLKSWNLLFDPQILKPCSVALVIQLMSSFTAEIPISEFAVDIFNSSRTDLDEYHATIIFGIVDFVSAVLAALIVDRFGRRPLLIGSQFVMAITLGALGLFFYLKTRNGGEAPDGLDWLPITSLGIFVAAFSVGTGPISYMILGEILPSEVKGIASGIVNTMRWLSAFLVTKYFLDVMVLTGEEVGYSIFGGLCVVGGLYAIFFVPETKGKTLEEIQALYH